LKGEAALNGISSSFKMLIATFLIYLSMLDFDSTVSEELEEENKIKHRNKNTIFKLRRTAE